MAPSNDRSDRGRDRGPSRGKGRKGGGKPGRTGGRPGRRDGGRGETAERGRSGAGGRGGGGNKGSSKGGGGRADDRGKAGRSGARGRPARDDDRPPRGRRPSDRRDGPVDPRTKTWGRVARRGAAHLTDAGATKKFREAVEDETGRPWEPEETWVDEGPVREKAEQAVDRARRDPARAARAEPDTASLKRNLPASRGAHAERDVKKAAKAFQREYFRDAEKLLKPLHQVAPDDLTVLELYGLTLYRLERWRAAAEKLERFARLADTVEQHPVIADCRRALGHHKRVAEVWEELRERQAPGALMAEGRIVYAGDLADQGRIEEAIRELERSRYEASKPKPHHLRLRYALADLYERSGDLPRARELFASVVGHDADFFDAERRLRAVGG